MWLLGAWARGESKKATKVSEFQGSLYADDCKSIGES